MSLARVTAWTLFVAAGFALAPTQALAQDPPLPRKPNTSGILAYRDQPRGGIPKEELKRARELFQPFGKYFADVVAHPSVWKASQDIKLAPLGTAPPPTLDGPDGILREIDRFLIEPGVTRTPNLDPADYIREMGAAFDAPLKELIETHPERIVRVNAARVLAHVARTGSPPHFPTVTALLANANTPTEVKYYLFQAAANLLAVPDVTYMKIRRHGANPETIGALVKAIQDCITNPAMILPGVADQPGGIPDDQLAVLGFVRRQAVRALAQVKFVSVPGPDGKTPLYPSYTLVRIALGDPALVPPAGPAEAAEAAIGICNMAPTEELLKGGFKPVKDYNADVAVEAVTAALLTFAKPRAADALDRSLPWRAYSIRLADALRNWRPLFDPDFGPGQTKFTAALVPQDVKELYQEVVPKVLAPMDDVNFMGVPNAGARVDIEGLQKRLMDLRARPKRNTLLFASVPETTIKFPPPKKADAPPKKDAAPPKK